MFKLLQYSFLSLLLLLLLITVHASTSSASITSTEFDLISALPEKAVNRVRLLADFEEAKEAFLASKPAIIEKLSKLKQQVSWFAGKGILDDSFVKAAETAIDTEIGEYSLGEALLQNTAVDLPALKEAARTALERAEVLDSVKVEAVKKWILACKFFGGSTTCKKDTTLLLTDWDKTAVTRLQKNHSLLKKLSEEVKVGLWPVNLNFAKFLVDNRNDMATAKKHMMFALTELQGQAKEEPEAAEEVRQRTELLERFLAPGPNEQGITTVPVLNSRLKAFLKIVDVFVVNLSADNEGLTQVQKDLIKKWVFVHQMMYAADWVSRTGGFVKPWPATIGNSLGGFSLPDPSADGTGYFSENNVIVHAVLEKEQAEEARKAEEQLAELNKLEAKSVKNGLKKEKKKDMMSLFFGSKKKKTDDGADESKKGGFLSSLFGSKTAVDDGTKPAVEENGGSKESTEPAEKIETKSSGILGFLPWSSSKPAKPIDTTTNTSISDTEKTTNITTDTVKTVDTPSVTVPSESKPKKWFGWF